MSKVRSGRDLPTCQPGDFFEDRFISQPSLSELILPCKERRQDIAALVKADYAVHLTREADGDYLGKGIDRRTHKPQRKLQQLSGV